MARRSRLAVAILLLIGGGAFWLWIIEPIRRHGEFCQTVRVGLQSLAKRRPPAVTRKQWENVVGWTLNAHANCLTSYRGIPAGEMAGFETGLKRRLSGPIDLATIDWVWDEIVRLTPGGQRYSDNWRPTTPERLREFEEGNMSWGIAVD